jgi:hypothetical protein
MVLKLVYYIKKWDSITSVRKSIVKNKKVTNAGDDVEKRELLHTVDEYKLAEPVWKTIWSLLRKLTTEPP